MALPSAAAPGPIRLSAAKTRRDYRLRLAILLADIVMVVGFYGFA